MYMRFCAVKPNREMLIALWFPYEIIFNDRLPLLHAALVVFPTIHIALEPQIPATKYQCNSRYTDGNEDVNACPCKFSISFHRSEWQITSSKVVAPVSDLSKRTHAITL